MDHPHDRHGGATDEAHDLGAEGECFFDFVVRQRVQFAEVVAGGEDGARGTQDEEGGEASAFGSPAAGVDEPTVRVFVVSERGFEGREERWLEGWEDQQLAGFGGGIVGDELGAEIAEDREGEGVAARRVVEGEVDGAGGEGGEG